VADGGSKAETKSYNFLSDVSMLLPLCVVYIFLSGWAFDDYYFRFFGLDPKFLDLGFHDTLVRGFTVIFYRREVDECSLRRPVLDSTLPEHLQLAALDKDSSDGCTIYRAASRRLFNISICWRAKSQNRCGVREHSARRDIHVSEALSNRETSLYEGRPLFYPSSASVWGRGGWKYRALGIQGV